MLTADEIHSLSEKFDTALFSNRVTQHEVATRIVRELLDRYGGQVFESGIEGDDKRLWTELTRQYDSMSIMMRFKPDQICVWPELRSVLFEIKTEAKGRPNFAIEADSRRAAKMWDSDSRRVAYIFVDFSKKTFDHQIKACWSQDIKDPRFIRVPKRDGWRETKQRMCNQWQDTTIITPDHRGGSGTPFFLIDKTSDFLVPIRDWIDELTGSQQLPLMESKEHHAGN